jgi:hypothetical protein
MPVLRGTPVAFGGGAWYSMIPPPKEPARLGNKNPWRILAETELASLCDAPNFGENANFEFVLGD